MFLVRNVLSSCRMIYLNDSWFRDLYVNSNRHGNLRGMYYIVPWACFIIKVNVIFLFI